MTSNIEALKQHFLLNGGPRNHKYAPTHLKQRTLTGDESLISLVSAGNLLAADRSDDAACTPSMPRTDCAASVISGIKTWRSTEDPGQNDEGARDIASQFEFDSFKWTVCGSRSLWRIGIGTAQIVYKAGSSRTKAAQKNVVRKSGRNTRTSARVRERHQNEKETAVEGRWATPDADVNIDEEGEVWNLQDHAFDGRSR